MKNQQKVKKLALSGVLALLCALACFGMMTQNAKAGTSTDFESNIHKVAPTQGLYKSISFYIKGEAGKVCITAKNDLTIFPSTVIVIVELYSSDAYQSSYTNMQLVARNTINDLNMGETLTAEASTNGEQKYWHGVIKYKIGNQSWETASSETLVYSANGTYLGVA